MTPAWRASSTRSRHSSLRESSPRRGEKNASGAHGNQRQIRTTNEIAHLRIHHFAPTAAAENAVVASALDHAVRAAARRNAGAQIVRRFGLADAGDVVQLAFDGEQAGALDRRRVHAFAGHFPQTAR